MLRYVIFATLRYVMKAATQRPMWLATLVVFFSCLAWTGIATGTDTLPEQGTAKPSPNMGNGASSAPVQKARNVREHLQLQPVTEEQFRAASKITRKSSTPGIRDHLHLKPLTADDFKNGVKSDRKPATE